MKNNKRREAYLKVYKPSISTSTVFNSLPKAASRSCITGKGHKSNLKNPAIRTLKEAFGSGS